MITRQYVALFSVLVVVVIFTFLFHIYGKTTSLHYMMINDTSVRSSMSVMKRRQMPQSYLAWNRGLVSPTRPAIKHNCAALKKGNQKAIRYVKIRQKRWQNAETEEEFARKINNCTYIREEFGNLFYVSEEELEFPLAFSLVVHDRPKQVYRLLKAIYRPHNIYCIHTDGKQSAGYISIFLSISQCLDNVLVSSHLSRVYWGHHSLMDAQLRCARNLMRYPPTRWKYIINICGFELPLRTNREIVQALKVLNGSSAVDTFPISEKDYEERFTFKYYLGYSGGKARLRLPLVPHNITIFKSMTQVALTHDFVQYLFTNKKAVDFRDYLKDVWIPEEEYYASLYHLPEAPGGFTSIQEGTKVPIVDQYIWMYSKDAKQHPEKYCAGAVIHGICMLTSADLSRVHNLGLNSTFAMFFNKFDVEHDHIVMDCMEERLVFQNKKEFALDRHNVHRTFHV